MFNKFKQKIADGVEGVSAGRQTPPNRIQRNSEKNTEAAEVWPQRNKRGSVDSGTHNNSHSPNSTFEALLDSHSSKIKSSPQEVLARVHHLIEVGRAQAQNNGRIEDNENFDGSADTSHLENNSFSHEENYMTSTPLEMTHEDEPPTMHEPIHSSSSDKPLHSSSHEPLDSLSDEPLRTSSALGQQPVVRKSSRQKHTSHSTNRSNRCPQDERVYVDGEAESSSRTYNMSVDEIFELYHKQDTSLRRYKHKFSELVDAYKGLQKDKQKIEAIAREQESKRHLEIGEKDDEIHVLKTQVNILKNKHGLSSPVKEDGSEDGNDEEEESHDAQNEQEDTIMEGVMNNMHELLKEQEELQAQINILRDELKNRDVTIVNMRRDEASSEERVRNALRQQEVDLQMVFEEKESQLKNLFADKVHDLQRVMEENEKQKKISLYQKDSDVMRTKDELSILKEQINEWNDREAKMKTKIQKIISEKEVCDKRFSESQQQLEQEKEKQTELIAQHTKLLKEKQEESNEQIGKVKRTSQTKVYEAQDQLRKKTNELNEVMEKHKIELDSKVKESTQFMQSEHAKASRKLELKVSDMKKMIKELRQKLTEKEGFCNELEVNLLDAKTEVEQAKPLNTRLTESEKKVDQLNCDIEALAEEVKEWKKKHEDLCTSYDELSTKKKAVDEQLMEKDVCIKELLNMANEEKFNSLCKHLEVEKEKCLQLTHERDIIRLEMQQMMDNVKEEENTLQCELNNLKTKFSYVEEESKELTQQLHNKVSEIELLGKTLDTVNKRLALKDNNLKERSKSFDELQARYELFVEEKQQFEYKHNEAIFELEESKNESESRLKDEYELKLQEFRNQLLDNKESSVEVVTSQLGAMHKQELLEMESQYEHQLNELHNDLKSKIDAVEKKHREYVEQNEEEKTRLITDREEKVQKLEHDLLSTIQGNTTLVCEKVALIRKLEEELSAKGEEGNIVVEELQTNLREQENKHKLHIDELTLKHKREIEQLESSYKEEIINVNSNYEKAINDHNLQLETIDVRKCGDLKDHLLQTKLSEQEIVWTDKHQDLENKFKHIISDRDKQSKTLVHELHSKHSEEIASLQDAISSKEIEFANQRLGISNEISMLKQKVEEGNSRLKVSSERYENELSSLRSRENEARSQLEQCKTDNLNSKKHYESRVATFQTKALEDKCIIEELHVKIMSLESNSKEIDAKFSELLIEKCEVEHKLSTNQHIFDDRIRHLETKSDTLNDTYEENIRNLEDHVIEQTKSFENEKYDILSKQGEDKEENNTKLLDFKKKAEMKISKLKKETREKVKLLDSTKTQVEEKNRMLERHLEEQQIVHEKQMSMNFEEYDNTMRSASEKFNAELLAVNDELLVKCEKVIQLEERLDNATVDKMNALNAQKTLLGKEYKDRIRKINEENRKQKDTLERELSTTIDEKEFQHTSEVKSMLKQFQCQLANKDMEMQKALQESSEVAQRTLQEASEVAQRTLQEASEVAQQDERQLISKYDQKIAELQKELHLGEEDMLALQIESQQQFDLLREEREIADNQHQEEFEKLEVDYQDLSKRYEKFLQNISQNEKVCKEEEEGRLKKCLNEVEEIYALRAMEVEDNHRSEMLAQEKKYKSQLKQAKVEMRKVLSTKGVIISNGGDDGHLFGGGSDNTGVLGPATSTKNDRPATLQLSDNGDATALQLCDNHDDVSQSPPKSPQPLEFEYLRNILYNYMMGKQRKQMAKVLTAIVHFTPSQVQQILAKVEEQEAQSEKKSSSWL